MMSFCAAGESYINCFEHTCIEGPSAVSECCIGSRAWISGSNLPIMLYLPFWCSYGANTPASLAVVTVQ
jgi:hypothetical protein